MSLSTSQRLRLTQVKAGEEVKELRQISESRKQNGTLKISQRVKVVEKNIAKWKARNDKFSAALKAHKDDFALQAIALEETHANNYTEIRKSLNDAKTSILNKRDEFRNEIVPFRDHQRAGIEHLGELLDQYLELRASAEFVHQNVTGAVSSLEAQ